MKAHLHIYLSKHEHLVDNEAVLDFAKGNSDTTVYFMDTTHYFGKSEVVLDEITRITKTANVPL